MVSAKGIETDPKKVEAVKNWTIPKTVTDVRSFLSFTNYYRQFIKDYARVARPLNTLILGENATKKKKLVEWDEQCQKAFDTLKDLCGGVLYQKDKNGLQRVIAYASRSLSHTERNYPAHKLEFLALKWAITDRFHEYPYGGKFDVFTDNNPLTYSNISQTRCLWSEMGGFTCKL